jgi:hypothetical protein
MNRDRVGCGGGLPPGCAKPQREIEILQVEEDRLVEAADLFPSGATVPRGPAGGPG